MAAMLRFHVPDDPDLLAAFGAVALRHEHLNHVLRMTIKTLADLSVDETLDATAFEGTSTLRDRVKKLARQRLGEGAALLKVQALVERCRRVTDLRNSFVHSVWAEELDGPALRRDDQNQWVPIPTTGDLAKLADDILKLTTELNDARLMGFLAEALAKRPTQ
jgi:hypothetical protein